jgi:hypothetical protein
MLCGPTQALQAFVLYAFYLTLLLKRNAESSRLISPSPWTMAYATRTCLFVVLHQQLRVDLQLLRWGRARFRFWCFFWWFRSNRPRTRALSSSAEFKVVDADGDVTALEFGQ